MIRTTPNHFRPLRQDEPLVDGDAASMYYVLFFYICSKMVHVLPPCGWGRGNIK